MSNQTTNTNGSARIGGNVNATTQVNGDRIATGNAPGLDLSWLADLPEGDGVFVGRGQHVTGNVNTGVFVGRNRNT